MGETDPVPWAAVEAVNGPPAADVTEFVDRLADDVRGDPPAVAVRTVYDAWKTELGTDRSTGDQGAAYVVRYCLERDGAIHPDGDPLPGVVDRRPDDELLRQWFHDDGQTLWWIATRTGTHHSLVSYWLWEAGIPLLERNLTEETAAAVERYRAESGNGEE